MVEVRPATADDVAGIRAVASDAWHAAYGDVLPTSTVEAMLEEWYAPEAVTRAVRAESVVYLVAHDEAVVGYASAGGDEQDPATALLRSIYVTPDRWGDGIGSRLFEAASGRLREAGYDRVRATVLAANDVGRAFYDRRGFEPAGTTEERLAGDRYDAVVLERPL